jgi:hypothetical protein
LRQFGLLQFVGRGDTDDILILDRHPRAVGRGDTDDILILDRHPRAGVAFGNYISSGSLGYSAERWRRRRRR